METYFHIPVTSHLVQYVTGIWEVHGKADSSERILPKGVVEIVFNFADRIDGLLPFSEQPFSAARCFIQGLHTQVVTANYQGLHHLFGFRLRPDMVHSLLGVLPYEFNNANIDLSLIDASYNELWHRLAEAGSFNERVEILAGSLPRIAKEHCQRSATLCELFLSETPEGFHTVEELARQVCYSSRQLGRVTRQLFGLSPGELIIYKKYLRAATMVHYENASLTDIAYRAGFYDQAHFCRVFKGFSGLSPGQYREEKGDLPFHIIS